MVSERPVTVGLGRHRAQAEPGVHVRRREPSSHEPFLLGVEQTGPEQMPDVAGHGVDRTFVRVQRDRRVAAALVVDPELLPESRGKVGCPYAPSLGARSAECLKECSAGQRGLVRVALDLAQGDRSGRESPVAPLHRVAGVLPSLVSQAPTAEVRVLQEAITIRVAVVGHPGEGPLHRGKQCLDLVRRHAPTPGVVQEADPQRSGVDRPVVDGRKFTATVAEVDRLVPHLVQDLPRLLGGLVIDDGALVGRKHAQSARSELGAERQQHARRPKRVTPEQREEPRRTCGEEGVVRRERRAHPQSCEVGERLVDECREPAVVAGHGRDRPLGSCGRRRSDESARCRRCDLPAENGRGTRGHRRTPHESRREWVDQVDLGAVRA
ncbi:hypothetical protein GALL_367410 [mine drainage metagenome]|uniref:Uncharacterized protein n=1 Tax=mine drainage metagenome TaxID=410659 RepID=A0A1J5QVI2_9ZZZZ